MIAVPRTVRVFAFPQPADLRKGFNGLYGLVRNGLDRDPLSGDLYLFVNRRRTGCKILLWDGTGLCILMKRLERGKFAALWRDGSAVPLQLTASELALFIEGCVAVGKMSLSPKEIVVSSVA